MLTRRTFVQTVGTGARRLDRRARPREQPLVRARADARSGRAAASICLSSNENPLGPGKAVLDAITAAFGPTGARPGRYSGTLAAR